MIKLLLLDVDGVLTDGRKTYDFDGNVLSKEFHDRDFTAIKQFTAGGTNVNWISGDRWNSNIANQRNIPFICTRRYDGTMWDKRDHIIEMLNLFKPQEIAFVGDDLFDLGAAIALRSVGGHYVYCPATAHYTMKEVCTCLKTPSGMGVVAELYDLLLNTECCINRASTEGVLKLDANEQASKS